MECDLPWLDVDVEFPWGRVKRFGRQTLRATGAGYEGPASLLLLKFFSEAYSTSERILNGNITF